MSADWQSAGSRTAQQESAGRATLGAGPLTSSTRVVIVLPTYNERENIRRLIPALQAQLAALPYDSHILVVDDRSPDGTADEVDALSRDYPNLHLLTGEKQGLGAAYIRGIKYALDQLGANVVMQMDADFSHRVEDVPRLLSALEGGHDFIIGSRYVDGGSIVGDWGFMRRLQSRTANLFARVVAGMWSVRDCTAGFRAIRGDLLRRIGLDELTARGYSFQIQLVYEALKKSARVKELPVHFIDRVHGETKLGMNPKERLEFLMDSLSIRFRRLETFLKFATIGASGIVINLGAFFLLTRAAGLRGEFASPIAIEMAIISNFIWNNLWTFGGLNVSAPVPVRFLKFNTVSLTALAMNFSVFWGLHKGLGVYDLAAQFVGVLAAVAWNYIVNVNWTWKVADEEG